MEQENFHDLTDEEYFGELKLLFNTRGWKVFLAEMMDNSRAIDNLQDVTDMDDLQFRKGQLAIIGNLMNLEDTIKRAEEDAANESL